MVPVTHEQGILTFKIPVVDPTNETHHNYDFQGPLALARQGVAYT